MLPSTAHAGRQYVYDTVAEKGMRGHSFVDSYQDECHWWPDSSRAGAVECALELPPGAKGWSDQLQRAEYFRGLSGRSFVRSATPRSARCRFSFLPVLLQHTDSQRPVLRQHASYPTAYYCRGETQGALTNQAQGDRARDRREQPGNCGTPCARAR